MVAISIFAIVALVSVQAFITADRINKRAQAMKTVIDNLHFALNVMAFNLKQGGSYVCYPNGSDVPPSLSNVPEYDSGLCETNGGEAIAFKTPKSSAEPRTIAYKFEESGGVGSIQYQEGNGSFVPITVDNLDIDDMSFRVINAERNASGMPRVFITLSGTANLGHDSASFYLQTVVSERY